MRRRRRGAREWGGRGAEGTGCGRRPRSGATTWSAGGGSLRVYRGSVREAGRARGERRVRPGPRGRAHGPAPRQTAREPHPRGAESVISDCQLRPQPHEEPSPVAPRDAVCRPDARAPSARTPFSLSGMRSARNPRACRPGSESTRRRCRSGGGSGCPRRPRRRRPRRRRRASSTDRATFSAKTLRHARCGSSVMKSLSRESPFCRARAFFWDRCAFLPSNWYFRRQGPCIRPRRRSACRSSSSQASINGPSSAPFVVPVRASRSAAPAAGVGAGRRRLYRERGFQRRADETAAPSLRIGGGLSVGVPLSTGGKLV